MTDENASATGEQPEATMIRGLRISNILSGDFTDAAIGECETVIITQGPGQTSILRSIWAALSIDGPDQEADKLLAKN